MSLDTSILQPMDIVVVDGNWYNPLHRLIQWRCLDSAVHCFPIINPRLDNYELALGTMKIGNLKTYIGKSISIHRYKNISSEDLLKVLSWTHQRFEAAQGYNFFGQWFMGYVFGFRSARMVDEPNRWDCSELPYCSFQENGFPITVKEETLPMPRLFRYSTMFETIYSGIL